MNDTIKRYQKHLGSEIEYTEELQGSPRALSRAADSWWSAHCESVRAGGLAKPLEIPCSMVDVKGNLYSLHRLHVTQEYARWQRWENQGESVNAHGMFPWGWFGSCELTRSSQRLLGALCNSQVPRPIFSTLEAICIEPRRIKNFSWQRSTVS